MDKLGRFISLVQEVSLRALNQVAGLVDAVLKVGRSVAGTVGQIRNKLRKR